MGIITPLILSIVVCVALRLILYRKELLDNIVQAIESDPYCTWASMKGRNEKVNKQSDVPA